MGFDFLEFEFQQSGKMRYVNSTRYKGENKIQKNGTDFSIVISGPRFSQTWTNSLSTFLAWISPAILAQVKEMVVASKVIEYVAFYCPEPPFYATIRVTNTDNRLI
jgi:hypothetical protein